MKLPKTRLSTAMSGSAKETERRVHNLFVKHRRPALALVAVVALAIGLCGSLVACRVPPADEMTRLEGLYDSDGAYPGQELLASVRGRSGTLVAGHYYDDYPRYTLVIGVEDDSARLTGPVFSVSSSGGRPQVSTFERDGVDYLLYTVNGGGQGTTYGEGGLLAFDGTDFTWVWPVEGDLRQKNSRAWADYQAYWEDKLALLCPGGVELFQQSEDFAPMTSGDKQWYFSQRIQFTQEETAVPGEIMDELRRVLEDRTRDQDNPWQASNTSAQWQIVQVTPGEETLCGRRYTLLASSVWSNAHWLGMELLKGERNLILSVVTGTEEEVRQALSEAGSRKETETLSLTTASGRALSVELELEPLDQEPDYLAVEQIRVYENGRLLQSIGAEDTGGDLLEGLFVYRSAYVGEPDLQDLNFDGSTDLGLLSNYHFPHNVSYGWFLWDEAESRFAFSTVLCSELTLDAENRQVVEHIRGDAGRREEAVYVWTEEGTLEQISYR